MGGPTLVGAVSQQHLADSLASAMMSPHGTAQCTQPEPARATAGDVASRQGRHAGTRADPEGTTR